MSRLIHKPNDSNDPIDPITPIKIVSTPEDERLLREVRRDAAGYEEWDPDTERQTSELAAIPRQTSGSMGIIPPHTRYIISSENAGVFGETHNAICKHLRDYRWNTPGSIILPCPLYERLEWDTLTPKPFSKTYLFIVVGMQRPFSIPIYRDIHVQIVLPHDTILCLLS